MANYDVTIEQLIVSRDEYVLLKPEYVVPEFLMHIRVISDDTSEQRSDYGEQGSGPTTHTTGGSSKLHSNSSSRKITTSKILVPSSLTLAPRKDNFDGEYDGDGISERITSELGSGSGSLFSESDGIGKLFMMNKIGSGQEETEVLEKETSKSLTLGRRHSGLGPGSLGVELCGAEWSQPSVSEEEEGRSRVSEDHLNMHLQPLKKKQSIVSSLFNAQQDWRSERRRIVEGVCSHLKESHYTPSPCKDRTLNPDRNLG
jgi:hypothetical protein